ncbi:MAG: hypothetical protein IKZ82_10030 [Clostridia bacterium]|nr:hypothetical protein [Clostridia bacterium]
MKKISIKPLALLLALVFALTASALPLARAESGFAARTADAYDENDYQKLASFLELADASGVKNGEKLSESYDVLDPGTWGVKADGEPRFRWTEADGKLRIESIDAAYIPGGLRGALDLSNCTSLYSVIINRNELTAVDVSDCTSLYLLNCAQNSIASFNASGCSALRFLECRWNLIPNLDLSSSPELTVLICTDNRMKTLDLTANPLLGIDFLRMADSGNKFVSCYIAQDPEYNDENLYFISADCADSCTTYNGWYTEDGRFISNQTVITPDAELGTRFVARFTLYGAAPGDADANGTVDLGDALKVLRMSMGLVPMQSGAGADVNGDGSVNGIDALLIMRRSMGLS